MFGSSPNDSAQPQNIFVRVLQLDVDLEADDRLVDAASAHPTRHSLEADRLLERVRRVEDAASLKAGPAIWKPTGRPSESPHGIEIAGMPASGIGTVK